MSMREFDISDALARLKAAGDKYDVVPVVVNEVPKPKPRYELPPTGSYSVFKRSNRGLNKRLYMNLPKDVANDYANKLNEREIERRTEERTMAHDRAMEYRPEVLYLYDSVEEGTKAESPYYNPPKLIID